MSIANFESSGRKAFTMIEMLVTIVIILLLTAILLRSVATFGEEGRRRRAVGEMEMLQHALNEYFVEYGSYPPVDFMAYEYEHSGSNHQSSFFRDTWLPPRNNPDDPTVFFPDVNDWADRSSHTSEVFDRGLGYRYGLVSYLWKRERGGHQSHWYDRDTSRDAQAKDGWAHYLRGLLGGGTAVHTSTPSMGINTVWTNVVVTVRDPWGREYRYESRPPFSRYRLWSTGPRGAGYPEDNIAYESWSE